MERADIFLYKEYNFPVIRFKKEIAEEKKHIHGDIRHTLFRLSLLLIISLCLVVLVTHFINHRPWINRLTVMGIALLSVLWLYFSQDREHYTGARISFFILSLVYVPFGYLTSPGSIGSMPYYIFFIMLTLTLLAVNWWEYLFPLLVIVAHAVLLKIELTMPDHFPGFPSEQHRIMDLSINYSVVSIFMVLSLMYVMRRYHHHSTELHNRSVTDMLTGLYNKGYLEESAHYELNRCKRTGDHLSLIFIDLNNFKRINDTLGHQEGDRVLREIAVILKENTRIYDICARYGGDEFVVLFPSTPKGQIEKNIDRLNEAFSNYGKKYQDLDFSVSYGLADNSEGDFNEIIELADQRLYDHKKEVKD